MPDRRSKSRSNGYEVGYRRPPVAFRFAKGVRAIRRARGRARKHPTSERICNARSIRRSVAADNRKPFPRLRLGSSASSINGRRAIAMPGAISVCSVTS